MKNNDLMMMLQQIAKNHHFKKVAMISCGLTAVCTLGWYLYWRQTKSFKLLLQESDNRNQEMERRLETSNQQLEDSFTEIENLKKDVGWLKEAVQLKS